MSSQAITVRALLLGEGLDLKGLERQDAFSINPLAFTASASGTAMLFKFGAVVFFNMTPVEEESLIQGLAQRINGVLDRTFFFIDLQRIDPAKTFFAGWGVYWVRPPPGPALPPRDTPSRSSAICCRGVGRVVIVSL